MAKPEINQDNCTGCGDCVDFCPTGAVAIVNDKAVIVKPEACDYCTECENICPNGAIRCPFEVVLIAPKTHKK